MGNFLDNFNEESYDTSNKQNKAKQQKKKVAHVEQENSKDFGKHEKAEKLHESQEAIATKNSQFAEVPETVEDFHQVEIDTTYHKKRQKKLLAGIALLATVCILGGLIWNYSQLVRLPNWVGKPVADLQKWSVQHKIQLEVSEKFDVKGDEGSVLHQKQAPDGKIRKGSTLDVTVSKGADPDEQLRLPEFSRMSEALIKTWIADNKANNMKIISEFHDEQPKGTFLRTEFKSANKDASNYLRKDYATIYVSKGKEVFEKNIIVPDFSDKYKAEVEKWAEENTITITYEEVAGTEDNIGKIVSQSIAAKEKVAKHDEMTVQVSLGKAAIVPWFGSMLKSEVQSYTKDGLSVQVHEQYSSTVAYGEMIYQSEAEGTELTGNDKMVTVVFSLGRPYLEDLKGMTENTLAPYFYNFKENGVELTYTLHYEANEEMPKGTVIRASRGAGYIESGTHIDIYISN